MEGCMFCGKDSFKKYMFDVDKPVKNVYVDEEVRDLLGEQYIDFTNDSKICLPCVCLVHSLCNFKHILKASLISYPKDGAIVKEFKKLNANLALIPYYASNDEEIDDYRSKNLDKRDMIEENELETEENAANVADKNPASKHHHEGEDDDQEDEMLSVMYSENISRATAYSPTSQEVMKSFKVSKRKKASSTSSIVTRAKSAPCEKTTKLLCDQVARKTNTPLLKRDFKDDSVVYHCFLSICYHHFESFDQLLHHVMSEHQQNDLNFEEYKQKLEEYLEKKNSKLKFDLCTNLQMEITKDIENKYPCLITSCYKKYKNITELNHHKVNDHNLWPRYSCPECYKVKFTSREDLILHNYKNHFVINSYCIYCSEPLKNIDDLYYHLETHEINKYPCKYCDKFFFSIYDARQHSKIHREDKYKQSIQRPRRRTIILSKYVFDADKERTPSEHNSEFSRVRLQPTYQSRVDEIVNVNTPDDQYIINRRNSFGAESTSSEDRFNDFTVPNAPSDNEGSTISDYINRDWSDINTEFDLNTSFDLDRCDDASTFSEYIKKKLTNEEDDVHSEITDNGSTISEFIKKRGDTDSNSQNDVNKKVTVLAEFLVKEGKVSEPAQGSSRFAGETYITSNKKDDTVEVNSIVAKKGVQVSSVKSVESFEFSGDRTNTELVIKTNVGEFSADPTVSTQVQERQEHTKDVNAKEHEVLMQVEANVNCSEYEVNTMDTFEFHDTDEDTQDKPASIKSKTKGKNEPTYMFDKYNFKSTFGSKDRTMKTYEFHKHKETTKKTFKTLNHENANSTIITSSEEMISNNFPPKPISPITLQVTNEEFDDQSSNSQIDSGVNNMFRESISYDSDVNDKSELYGFNYAELEKKFNLKNCRVILEDCSAIIISRLDQKMKREGQARKRGKKSRRKTRKKWEEVPPEPAKIDASCFEKFAAERLGLELENPLDISNQNITYQADFEIPCAETVEVIAVEADNLSLTEFNLLGVCETKEAVDTEVNKNIADEKPISFKKELKKRVRKREIQLLQQITPLEIQSSTSVISDSDRRIRNRKPPTKYEPLPVQNPGTSETVNIISETDVSTPEIESSYLPMKQLKRKGEIDQEPEILKTKIKRLGMTDIIKRTIPGKPKVRNNAL